MQTPNKASSMPMPDLTWNDSIVLPAIYLDIWINPSALILATCRGSDHDRRKTEHWAFRWKIHCKLMTCALPPHFLWWRRVSDCVRLFAPHQSVLADITDSQLHYAR